MNIVTADEAKCCPEAVGKAGLDGLQREDYGLVNRRK